MSFETFTLALPSVVLEVAGKGALISCAVLGLAAVLRRASAASRHLLLVLGAGCLLLLPVFAVGLPSRELAVLPAEPVRPVAAEPARDGHGPLQVVAAQRVQRAAAPASFRLPAAGGFALFVLAVAGLLLGRLALAVRRLGRLYAGSLAAPQAWLEIFDELKGRLEVRLGVSTQVAVPVTFGWRRPVVLLPEAARGWEEAQIREALLHELAHVRRHDWALQMVARAVRALHWFDPLVWLLSRRLLLEAELACDDQVLRAGAGPADYAGRLVALAREVRSAARRPAEAVSFARPSGLASRVAAILDPRRRRGGPGRLAVAGATVSALILLLVVAPARLVRAEQGAAVLSSSSLSSSSTPSLPSLLAAAGEGREEEVRRLLAAGAPVDQSPEGEATALMIAAERGHAGVVEALIEAGANLNVIVPGKGTPLIAAARGGDARIVRRLLSLGAEPNVYVTGDETALRQAIENNHAEAARVLIGAWKYPLPEPSYQKAVRQGVEGGIADGIADGVEEGRREALIEAAEHGDVEAVRFLLRQGADPNGAVSGDGSPLIAAAGEGREDVVQLLLEQGADPNLGVRGDGSPLIAAAKGGHAEVVRLLLRAGADVDQVVPGDENPLIQAAWKGRLEVVRILLDANADPNVRVMERDELRTPLRMARRGGHRDVERLLLERGARE
jgi:ankyrin repeat protein/beta-lactamase regulating signal transducer with metallopeptidase domain